MKIRSVVQSALTLLVLATLVAPALAAPVSISLPGTTATDGWADLTATNYPGLGGGFPGMAPWGSPIAANQPGSNGGGQFTKVSGAGFAAGASIYTFSPGTFSASSSTPVAGLETVVFQIDIGEGEAGIDLTAVPTLSYNGGGQSLAATLTALLFEIPAGDFGGEPITRNTWAFQWDLSGLGAISDFDIQWTTGAHAQTYALQLDQGSVFTAAVPEPASMVMALAGLLGLGCVALRRRVRG